MRRKGDENGRSGRLEEEEEGRGGGDSQRRGGRGQSSRVALRSGSE